MPKTLLMGIALVVGVGMISLVLLRLSQNMPLPPIPSASPEVNFDPRNASYTIDGGTFSLVNGIAEKEAASDSASKVTVRYFGNDAVGDLNGDGQKDVAFLITQSAGGSGLFYYAVVALKTEADYRVTNAFFLGDRIAPQSTYIAEDVSELRVNYAERKPGEPMTTQPSVGVTKFLRVAPGGVLEDLMK